MIARLRGAVAPAYILLCLLIGGSTQGFFFNLALQLIGVAIIVWSLIELPVGSTRGTARAPLLIALAVVLLALVQLIPLPPGLWTALPGREKIAEGYALLGIAPPWLPLSLAPYDTMATALTLIPPLAVLAAMLVLGAFRASWVAAAILVGAFASVMLGAVQVGSTDPVTSPWYLYPQSSFGFATGFFANSNHLGALLVISVPFLFALVRHWRDTAKTHRGGSAAMIGIVAGMLVLSVGVILNASFAVLLLILPVATLSATLLVPDRFKLRRPLLIAAAIALAGIVIVYLSPLGDRLFQSNAASLSSRELFWSRTLAAIGDVFPFGSGLGSFRDLYPLYEDAASVGSTVVNHAHNDYLEIALESGLPGLILLALFLGWWLRRAAILGRGTIVDPFAFAGIVASAALLLHSIVDFPLRMPALAAVLAACVALMARPRATPAGTAEDLWPTRHVSV